MEFEVVTVVNVQVMWLDVMCGVIGPSIQD